MKKRIFRSICLGICLVLSFMFASCVAVYGGCLSGYDKVYKRDVVLHEHAETDGYQRPEFSTKYTEEEHIERLHDLAMKKLYREAANGVDFRYEIYTVYSFQLQPEYFLIQEYYKLNYGESDEKPCRYWMGFIENDEYYIIVNDFYSAYYKMYDENLEQVYPTEEMEEYGENPYSILGVLDKKKFYGGFGRFAWFEREAIYSVEIVPFAYEIGIILNQARAMTFEEISNHKKCRFVYYDQRILFEECNYNRVLN